MYRVLDELNNFIAATSRVFNTVGEWEECPLPTGTEIRTNYYSVRNNLMEAFNLKLLGISGNVYVISKFEKRERQREVYLYHICNGVNGMMRKFPDPHAKNGNPDNCIDERGLISFGNGRTVQELIDSPDDFVVIRWDTYTPFQEGFKYKMIKKVDIQMDKHWKNVLDEEKLSLLRHCDELMKDNIDNYKSVRCPHCHEYTYLGYEGPVVYPCSRCGKLFVYERYARDFGIDPTLGRPNWMNNKTRWNHIDIGGV